MRMLDRILQRWRIAMVRPYVPKGARVLDIGCHDGSLFYHLRSRIGEGVGIDPNLEPSTHRGRWQLIPGWFPQDLPDLRPFDVITLMAVLEHIPSDGQRALARHCARLLNPGGLVIVTVPSSLVDPILEVLQFVRLIDGIHIEQHYGFDASQTPEVFTVDGLRLLKAEKFQLGLNNLFIFKKTAESHLVKTTANGREKS